MCSEINCLCSHLVANLSDEKLANKAEIVEYDRVISLGDLSCQDPKLQAIIGPRPFSSIKWIVGPDSEGFVFGFRLVPELTHYARVIVRFDLLDDENPRSHEGQFVKAARKVIDLGQADLLLTQDGFYGAPRSICFYRCTSRDHAPSGYNAETGKILFQEICGTRRGAGINSAGFFRAPEIDQLVRAELKKRS